jgi:hypothetical protein
MTTVFAPSVGLLMICAASLPAVSETPPADTGEGSAAATATPGATEQNPGIPSATILDNRNSRGILGSAVRSATNEHMGRIVDVVVDRAGTTQAAVIDFGGFLGVGSRKIAVDWSAMRFTGSNSVTIDLTREQVNSAPQYQEGKPIIVLSASPEFARSRVTARMPER